MSNKTVMVSGKFDPPHDGHIDHIVKASKLGDYLIIITHTDKVIKELKGYCNIPLWARVVLLKGILLNYNIKGDVLISLDTDGLSARSLIAYRPNVYAKGGDRTPLTMPTAEIEACKQIRCKIVYGCGDLLNSSSKMGNIKERKIATH